MNTFLIYILESTVCIGVFYLLFRLLMRKETSFAVNRATLLTIVATSVIVPLVQLPQLMQTPVHIELIPEFSENKIQIQNLPVAENATISKVQPFVTESTPATSEFTISLETLLKYFYIAGVLVAFLLFIRNIILIFLLSRKATVRQMDDYRLLIVDSEVPSFAFGRSVVISQTDYYAHGSAILAHEQAHIRLNHFVDLLLLELVKTIHWFNPAVYALIGDMKEIHEFQADEQTLHSGIDAKQYQLLIIQKGVGPRRFALANSFNHCQIKKRITMMNKSKTSKAWCWKVATFLPLLTLLLMAFGRTGENVPIKGNAPVKVITAPEIIQENQNQQSSRLIEIRKDGNYIDNKLCSLEETVQKGKEWGKASNDWIRLQIDQSIPYKRIDEILEQLEPGMYHITQSTVNSDDIIYFAGDVSEMAKFTLGKWDDWIGDQLKHFNEGKPIGWKYRIAYSFIIDKNGKVRDGHITKGCDYPEINAAYEKILAQIPDWKPARRGNASVSVYIRFSAGARIVEK
ncbi:MAG: M56 family metallopeptidase [Bacteroidota bacterium]|nr:M56 family metallopeptidase [Bacteroidota bacterium]